jgi:hypothetical protein
MFVWTVCAADLSLWDTILTGAIPSEIGMLSDSIGKLALEKAAGMLSPIHIGRAFISTSWFLWFVWTVCAAGLWVSLSSVSSDGGEALRNSSTPQSMAFNWTVTNNALLRPDSDEQIIQRYALATLFYSTHGDNWTENENWLDDGSECGRWETSSYYSDDGDGGVPLVCTAANEVSELDLGYNNLQGRLPPEIGLLSKLGEYNVID